MEEKSKGYSLRKKRSQAVRPKISGPTLEISSPLPPAQIPAAAPRRPSGASVGGASLASQSSRPSNDGLRPGGSVDPRRPPGARRDKSQGSIGSVGSAQTGRSDGPMSSSTRLDVPRDRDGDRSGSRERPGMGGKKTTDMVKRRYSTRYANMDYMAGAPPGAGAPPMPGVPSIPDRYADRGARAPPSREGRPSGDGRRVKVDVKTLRDASMNPDQYVASILADATESDIQQYQMDLQKLKNRTSTDLQSNVYQNRTQFIKISKEAEKLKGEMRTLRSLMSELTGALGQTTMSSNLESSNGSTDSLLPSSASSSRNNRNRSSVANLEALWNSQLQTLWKRVEGSQKFLPASPGRNIIYENGRWVELNAATWKARRRVYLILLNDHLLVATEKKPADGGNSPNPQQGQGQKPLVALRCSPLQDVQISDLGKGISPSSSGSTTNANAINVRVGAESFTYAVSSSQAGEKSILLTNYRKAAEELRKSAEAETQRRSKAPDSFSYFATRDNAVLQRQPGLLNGLSNGDGTAGNGLSSDTDRNRTSAGSASLPAASTPLLVDNDGKQRDLRWLESQLDELDVEIALQRFEEAVARVEHLHRLAQSIRGNSAAQDLMTLKVSERSARLAGVLTRQLELSHAWSTTTKESVGWLVRLGFEDRARESYLAARTQVLQQRARQTIFDGDLPMYLWQNGFITFVLIRNTLRTYQTCFPPLMLSAAVKWAKNRVEDFNVLLARQLSGVDRGGELWRTCLERARCHEGLLRDVGVDFGDLVGVPDHVADDEATAGTNGGAAGIGAATAAAPPRLAASPPPMSSSASSSAIGTQRAGARGQGLGLSQRPLDRDDMEFA